MTSLQALTAQINDVLDGGQPKPDGDIGHVAAAYAELSAQANFRLRRCINLLRKGLRSEAVHEAETEPELFELLQSLDLKRLQDWDRLCAENGLERPRPILMEGIKALNEAFAEERRLTPLLRRHRALALARGPLAERIDVLRRLRENDARNSVWAEDLQALEAARHREIEAQLRDGTYPRELTACNKVYAELVDARWLVKPPAGLVSAARKVLTEAQRRWADAELRKLLPQLHEAQSAWDAAACDRLMARWNDVMQAAGLADSDLPADLRAAWAPIADWSSQQADQRELQQQFEAAERELRQAIDQQADLDTLTRLHETVVRFDRPVSDDLDRDYQRRVLALRLAQHRQRRNILAATAAGLLLVVSVIALITHDIMAGRAAERRAGEVAAAVQSGDTAAAGAAREAAAGWQPLLFGRGGWRESLTAIDSTVQAADERRAAYEALVTQLEAAGPAGTTRAMLEEADRLAVGDAARRKVADLRGALSAHEREALAQREAAMLAKLDAASQKLAALSDAFIEAQRAEAVTRIAEIEADLAAVRAASEDSLRVRAALAPVESSARSRRAVVTQAVEREERRNAEAESVASLARLAYSSEALAGELRQYVQRFPDGEHASDFAQAAELEPAWKAVDAWASLLLSWRNELRPTTAAEAAQRVLSIDGYLTQHAASPLRSAAERYRNYLSSVVLIGADDGPWRSRVAELMKTPVMTELNMVETTDGLRFYTTGDGRYREDALGVHIDLTLTPKLEEVTKHTFTPGVIGRPVPSPQKSLARQVIQLTRTSGVAEAEAGALRVVEMVAEAEDVDAVLRALLLTLLADAAPAAGETLGDQLSSWVEPLRGFDLNSVNWMNGQDLDAVEVRESVSAAMSRMPRLAGEIDAALRRNEAAIDAAGLEIVGRGVLFERDGGFVVDGLSKLAPDATLVAVVRSPSGADFQLLEVGKVAGGTVTLTPRAAASVSPGSLVLATR